MLLHGIYTSNQDRYYSVTASAYDGVPVGNSDTASVVQSLARWTADLEVGGSSPSQVMKFI
jgi:hypothetical protein